MEPPIEGPVLVKMVTTVMKAAGDGDKDRTVDGLKQLGRQRVSASLLSSTGAGKKACLTPPHLRDPPATPAKRGRHNPGWSAPLA